MRTPRAPRPHLEIQRSGAGYVGILRTSYRDGDKVRHEQHGRITGFGLEHLRLLQAAMRGEVAAVGGGSASRSVGSREYGASAALLALAREIGLDTVIYSRPGEQWVKDCLAMIVGRVVYAGSKLALSQRWRDTALWDLCGVEGPVDVNTHCYAAMDRLLARQQGIQRTLARRHLHGSTLVLYDITSSYFEGAYEESEIVTFGYNRDGKRSHEQMVIGLVCADDGCPVGVEVFRGNTQDASTVPGKIEEVRVKYGIKDIVFVGDRGMVAYGKGLDAATAAGMQTVSALTHRQMVKLLERGVIQMDLFDTRNVVEVWDPDQPGMRYCLCKNPQTEAKEHATRIALLDRTRKGLEALALPQRRTAPEKTAAKVGTLLDKTKMGKFVKWRMEKKRLVWSFDEEKIAAECLFDGCYVVRSDVPAAQMDAPGVVASYKKLTVVERAFRTMKTVQLELRPVYHKTDDRIRCHVFVCMLAYYLMWHAVQRLAPVLRKHDTDPQTRWSIDYVIERLKSIRQERREMAGAQWYELTQPDAEQGEMLAALGVTL
jgi:hypothetical protein